ncbi:MAG: hypothetical protein HQK54_07070 [Oligoflexales bacterium]|nr:hypothetical protein [Oligoflexales bacterium]
MKDLWYLYAVGVVLCFGLMDFLYSGVFQDSVKTDTVNSKLYWCYAGMIGIINAAGFFLILSTLASGPLGVSQGIFSLAMVPPIILAAIVFKEPLTKIKILIISIALAALILVRF